MVVVGCKVTHLKTMPVSLKLVKCPVHVHNGVCQSNGEGLWLAAHAQVGVGGAATQEQCSPLYWVGGQLKRPHKPTRAAPVHPSVHLKQPVIA